MEPEDDSKFWRLALGTTLLLALGVLAAMFQASFNDPTDTFRLEAAKLLLQFVLAGVGGTLILAYLNQRRDRSEQLATAAVTAAEREAKARSEAERKQADARAAAMARAAARRAALQELIRQIGDAHRRLKVVKRQMRAAIAREEPDPRGPPRRPYAIPAAAFERSMQSLLEAQIASEEVRDRIGISIDLLGPEEICRIRMALRYGARYFHDVYEDYEHGRIKRVDDRFLITEACNNVHNFLFGQEPPPDLPAAYRQKLIDLFTTMHEENRDLAQRYAALKEIEDLRQEDCPGTKEGPHRRRYRLVATESYALAADELRRALWQTCPREAAGEATPPSEASAEAAGTRAAA